MLVRNLFGRNFLKPIPNEQKRDLWGYVAIAFNQVDKQRQQQVGPDRLCAEWLLKNGGAVRFKELPNRLICDYNILPPESQKVHVKVADASNSSVMKIGLEHFDGCKHIDTVILHSCKHLEGDGLIGLTYLTDTLLHLQVSSCYNITEEGLWVIGELKNLNTLTMFDMKFVNDIESVATSLMAKLPNCQIHCKQ